MNPKQIDLCKEVQRVLELLDKCGTDFQVQEREAIGAFLRGARDVSQLTIEGRIRALKEIRAALDAVERLQGHPHRE